MNSKTAPWLFAGITFGLFAVNVAGVIPNGVEVATAGIVALGAIAFDVVKTARKRNP